MADSRVVAMALGAAMIAGGALGYLTADSGSPAPIAAYTSSSTVNPTATSTTAMSTTTSTTSTVPPEDPAWFVTEVLGASLRAGDVETLVARLHPAVTDIFGIDQCQGYFPTVTDPELAITVQGVGEPAPWEWEVDGGTVSVEAAIPVDIVLVSKGNTIDQTMHVVDDDGTIRWFTDCGDPLGGDGGQ